MSSSSIKQFYESRYSEGYMSSWDGFVKERIFMIIKDFDLPEKGKALDYGCGRGIFTEIIKKALPEWEISGCDISENAVKSAIERINNCNFFVLDVDYNNDNKFDLIFTHHVLEHVEDVNKVFKFFENNLNSEKSWMLHILPCGNEGSFEYGIASITIGGIEKEKGKRFFFEDEGHLRRLTTKDMTELSLRSGFVLRKAMYSNHFLGAVEWITDCGHAFIRKMFDPARIIDRKHRLKVFFLRWIFLLIDAVKFADRKTMKILFSNFMPTPRYISMFSFRVMFKPLAKFVSYFLQTMAKIEWKLKKTNPQGSEMFLFFEKSKNK